MTWFDIMGTIAKLIKLEEFTVETCARVLECKFKSTGSNRYRSGELQDPFEYAELIPGSSKAILTLTLQETAAREEYAMRIIGLGKPIDIDIVSPPIAGESAPKSSRGWDRNYSLCYEIGDHLVWFEIEEINSKKKLVSASLERSLS